MLLFFFSLFFLNPLNLQLISTKPKGSQFHRVAPFSWVVPHLEAGDQLFIAQDQVLGAQLVFSLLSAPLHILKWGSPHWLVNWVRENPYWPERTYCITLLRMLNWGCILFFWAESDGKESADETVSLSNDSGPSSCSMEAWITSAACSSRINVVIWCSFNIPFSTNMSLNYEIQLKGSLWLVRSSHCT